MKLELTKEELSSLTTLLDHVEGNEAISYEIAHGDGASLVTDSIDLDPSHIYYHIRLLREAVERNT